MAGNANVPLWRHRLGWRNQVPGGAIAAGDYDFVYTALTRKFNPLARGGVAIAAALAAVQSSSGKVERARSRAVLSLLIQTGRLQGGLPRLITSLPAVGDRPAPRPKRYINRRTGKLLNVADSRKAARARQARRAVITRTYLAALGRELRRLHPDAL